MACQFELQDVNVKFPAGFRRGADIAVLRNLNLKIYDGDVIALVGANGAGKSTLLRLLGAVLEPSSGAIARPRDIDCLFDISSGLEQDATGLENIYIRAYYLDIPKRVVDDNLPGIIEFSGLSDAINRPIRTYSAGMLLRLTFSLLTVMRSNSLLIDEVIGVGDLAFFRKSIKLMEDVIARSGTVVIASHALATMKGVCTRGLWLKDGMVEMDGRSAEVIDAYEDYVSRRQSADA